MGDYLIHYGVKGMKWGIRHDPERQSSGRSKMSTAKKVAIGVGVAAAVAGVSYVSVTRRNNKLAKASVQKALRATGRAKVPAGGFNKHARRANMAKLTGHSKRTTRYGANLHKLDFYNRKAASQKVSQGYFNGSNNAKRYYESKADQAYRAANAQLKRRDAAGGTVPLKRYKTNKINKLRRQKGPKVLRVKG